MGRRNLLCSAALRRQQRQVLGAYRETIVKSVNHRSKVGRGAGVLFAAWICTVMGPIEPAAAENFFQFLFGGPPRFVRPEPLPPQTSSYADPRGLPDREPRRGYGEAGPTSGGGYGAAFCVRTCDGRYFPLQPHAGVSPAELCRSFCPASNTMLFYGGKIDHAIARNGMRYGKLENAFAYRDRVVENCTCNGRDGLGLAHLNTVNDPTLRPGDIVATNNGFVSYRGAKANTAKFTPIDASSSAWARRLSEVKILPAPLAAAIVSVPSSNRAPSAVNRTDRSAQVER
jgi:hypothetical protein